MRKGPAEAMPAASTSEGSARWTARCCWPARPTKLRRSAASWPGWMQVALLPRTEPKRCVWSMSWNSQCPTCAVGTSPVSSSSGTRSRSASTTPESAFSAPGPEVTTQTPSAPVSRAWAPAASAAALSWRMRTQRTVSWRSSAASSGTSGEPG